MDKDANRRLNRNEVLRPAEDHCASEQSLGDKYNILSRNTLLSVVQ
jgi:hypothetical protein